MPTVPADAPLEDRWITDALHHVTARVNASLENYRFDEAASEIYQFFWGSFCDAYIESVKLRLEFSENADKARTKSALTTLVSIFEASLRLLSPFMPFITEEIWQSLYEGDLPARSVALSKFPSVELNWLTANSRPGIDSVIEMDFLLSLKTEVLALRKEIGVEEKVAVPILLWCALPSFKKIIDDNHDLFIRLAKVSEIKHAAMIPPDLAKRIGSNFEVAVDYAKPRDVSAERERLTRDIAKYEKGLAAAERQLGNESFLAKAPAQVVEGLKKQELETRLLLEKARAALGALPKD
jgi:valyl-tRNA synthetase